MIAVTGCLTGGVLPLVVHHQKENVFSIYRQNDGSLKAEVNGRAVPLKGLPPFLLEPYIGNAKWLLSEESSYFWDGHELTVQTGLKGGGSSASRPQPLSVAKGNQADKFLIALRKAIESGGAAEMQLKAFLEKLAGLSLEIPPSPFFFVKELVEIYSKSSDLPLSLRVSIAGRLQHYLNLALVYTPTTDAEAIDPLMGLLDQSIKLLDDELGASDSDLPFLLGCAREGLEAFNQRDPDLTTFLKKVHETPYLYVDKDKAKHLPVVPFLKSISNNKGLFERSWYFKVLIIEILKSKVAHLEALQLLMEVVAIKIHWRELVVLINTLERIVSSDDVSLALKEKALEYLFTYLVKEDIEESWRVRKSAVEALKICYDSCTFPATDELILMGSKIRITLKGRVKEEKDSRVRDPLMKLLLPE